MGKYVDAMEQWSVKNAILGTDDKYLFNGFITLWFLLSVSVEICDAVTVCLSFHCYLFQFFISGQKKNLSVDWF